MPRTPTTEEARQGETGGQARYVLMVSTPAAVAALTIIGVIWTL
jgi:hypothetical protein